MEVRSRRVPYKANFGAAWIVRRRSIEAARSIRARNGRGFLALRTASAGAASAA
jgi:hypothetical protein